MSTPANNLPELPEGYRVEPVEPTPTQPGPATSRLPALPDGYRLEEPRALAGAAAQPSDDSQFTKGLKSGIDQTQGLLYGLAGLAGSAVGSKDLESWGLEGYQRNVDEAAQNAGRVSSVTDIRSGADFLDWSAYTLGNLVPTMAVLIGGGGIGGAIGKQAAKQGVKSYLSKALGEKAGRTVNEAALKRLATRALDKGVRRGQMAGAFAGSSGLEAGGIFADTVEENGQTHPGVAAAFGMLAGALDAIPVINLFDNWGIGREVKGAILKNLTQGKWGAATKKVLEQAALEGSTEGVQTVVERAAAKFVDDNKDIFSDEGWNEIINASAAGGLMGSVMGVPAGVIAHRQAGQPEAPPAPEIPERGTDLAGGESEDLLGAGDTALGAEEITIEDTLANAPGIDVQELSPEQVDVTRPLDTEGIDVTELQTQDLTAAPPPPDTAGIDVTELSAQDVAAAEPPVEPVDTTGIDVAELPLQETQPAAAPAEQVPTAGIDVAELTTEPAAAAPASVEDAIDQAAAEAATSPHNDLPEPTEAQKKAGNYKKGHVQVHGLDISIENPAGSKRRPEWPALTHDYGYIRRTEGADKDKNGKPQQVDVFIGPEPQSDMVYVIDQRDPKSFKFDEHKVMMGFESEQAAREGYLSNYGKGWKGMRGITAMTVPEFKDWLKNGDTKKPVGQSDTLKRVKARNAKKKGEEVPHTDDDRDMQVAEPAATPPRKPKPETSTDEVPFTDDGRDVPTEATDNAETVRSDEGQVRGRGNEPEKRQEKGGANLQRNQEKERAEAESEAQEEGEAVELDEQGNLDWEWDAKVASFPEPAKTVHANKGAGEYLSQDQANAVVKSWVDYAERVNQQEDHSNEVIISLFDHSNTIALPWAMAGYDVISLDMKDGADLFKYPPIAEIQEAKEAGKKIVGIIAQPPCTCFSSSGARWWQTRHDASDRKLVEKMFGVEASKYFSRPKEYTKALVSMVDLAVEFAEPDFWVIENPVGRIATEMGLPKPTLTFDPHVYGDPYTKRTHLWGKFNPDLPTANVKPTQGSLMHKLWSAAEQNKGLRSLTPEGFAFALFMANNTSKVPFEAGKPAETASTKPAQKTPEPAPAAPESGKLETEGETTPPQEAPDVSVERAGETALEGVSAEPVRTPAGRGPAERGGREGGDAHAPGYESAPGDSGADVRRGVGSGEGEVSVPAAGEPATRGVGNYRITEADELGRGGVKTKFAQNVAAIRLAKELVESGQPATLEQQKILAKYVGWGGMPQAFPRPDGSVAKGWEKQAEELREVLSDEEYAAARRSTQDAHYTSPTVVGAIYNALARFGFTGGKVLEPSVGTGNFLGLTPSALRSKARWTGIELDPLTSKIAQLLYPKADIINNGFQDVAVPSGSFDLVIGNPPFGSQRLFDPNHKDISKFSIHNFFFAKSIEATRPGGLIAMVVSNYMLDSTKAGAREYMGDKVNFLGAIRLPNTAFKENAGTEVTTDIIFLQKRGEGVPVIDTAWTDVDTIADPAGGEAITINEYFIHHPEMMLGEMRREGSMYAKDSAALIAPKDQDLAAELEAAVAKLPANAMEPVDRIAEEPAPQPVAPGEMPETTKVWGFFEGVDGEIMQRTPDELDKRQSRVAMYEDSKGTQRPFSESEKKRIRGLIALANAFREQIAAERTNATDIEAKRKKLNRLYDAHVKKFGLMHSQGTKLVFEGTPDYPTLLSLERNYERAVSPKRAKQLGIKPRKARADKADIFTKRVNHPDREITRVDDADSALKVSLNQRGKVDVDYMAQLSGQDPERIIKDLAGRIYLDPVAGWVTADEYLSGNVKAKLAQAKEQTDPRFAANIEALEKVQPDDVEPVDISVRLGAPWIPAEDMQDFITHLLQIPSHAQYSTLTGTWIVKLKGRPDRTRNHEMWGIEQMGASRIIDNVVNNRPVRVTYRDSNGSTIVDQEATAELNAKADAIRQEFLEWVWKDEGRRDRLARLYNDTFNHSIQRRYDGSHLTLPGMNATITLRQHQKDVIWRAIQEGRLLMDHVVGAGKTFAAIAVGMEMRRLGLANKPMYVVPNHLVEQWAADFQRLYPGANVLAATKKDFQKQNRRKFFSRIATGDYDAIIVAHSSFKFIPTPLDEYQAFLEEQIKDLVAAIEEMEEAGESKRTVKQLEKMKETLENKIKKAMEDRGSKDDVVDMGEMGVDSLIVDEAHLFKNLFFATKRARQGISVTESERATDLFVKVRTLQKKNSGRGAYFLTGTPISNSISEMFTMQRYLDYATLQQQGITHFDAWADTFANFTTAFEISSTGQGLSLKTRLSEFTNVPELMTMYGQFADVITMDDLERQAAARGKRWPVPKVKGGKPENLIVPISTEQSAYMMEIVHRAENLDPRDPQKDNMLKITNDARKAALDMRLIDPGIEDNPDSKTSTAANRIFDLYTRWKKDRGTQLVFIDLSTPKSARSAEQRRIQDLVARARDGDETAQAELEKVSPDDILALSSVFDVYNDLKDKLIAKGVHEGEIAFIHDAKTEKQKEDLMEQVRAGNVRILLGSTSKMGAGMNVQDKLIALHHLDAPWRPSDLEQREGRIVRQGNEFYERDPDGFEIEIVRYATERTYDSRMWQTIERKAKFIGQLRKAQAGVRVVEDIGGEAANAAEMKAAATGNPLILEQVDLDHKVRQLEIRKKQHTRSQHRLQQTISRLEADGGPASRAAEKKKIVQANIATRDQNTPKNDKGERVFTATINGKMLDTHTKAGKALKAAVAKFLSSKGLQRGTRETIGSYRGFDVLAGYRGQTQQGYDGITVDLDTAEGHKNVMWTDTNGLKEMADVEAFKILDRYMKEWDNVLEEIDDRASREKAELATAKEEIKKPFKDKEELEKAKKRLAEVTAELTKKDEDKKPGEPDVARSQREPATSLATADAVRETLRDMFGKRADRFTVVQSTDDLPNKWGVGFSGTIGLAEKSTGAIYLVADNIDVMDRAGLYGVILHEIFHVAMSKDPRLKAHMDRFTAKLAEMRRRALAGEDSEAADFYRVANALVPKNTPKELDLEEFAAYALQVWEKPTTSIPEAISKLIKDLVAAIRMALVRAGLYRPKDITPADLSALARSWFRREDYVSVEGEQLSVSSDRAKSVIARATRRTAPSRQLTPEQQAAMEKHAPQAPRKPIRQRIMEMKQDFGLKVSQGIFDQYASLKNLSEKAWMLARQTHSVSGAVEAAFTHGKLKLDRSGAIDVDTNGQGLAQALRPLGEELDHFLMWIAGNRSDRLNRRSATATRMAKDRINQAKQLEAQARRLEVGATRQQVQQKKALRKQATRLRNEAKALEDIASVRERLFTDQEVAALKTLNRGTMADGRNRAEVYRTALAELNAFQKSVLDIAEQTGTIDPQERARWDEDFYVPFYRLLQEEGQKVRGPSSLRSLVNQTAYKRLKGADIPLNDLLSNVLMNWSHLLSASLRNQAATEALTQANRAGIATPIRAHQAGKGSVFIRVGGQKQYFDVDDELVLEALTALNWEGFNNPAMQMMRKFKRGFTIGVTASPEFRIANLLRDTIHAAAVTPLSYNLLGNLLTGTKGTSPKGLIRARMLAGGGEMHFGHLYAADPEAAKLRIQKGIQEHTVLNNPEAFKTFRGAVKTMWDSWAELGSRVENVNRAALFQQVLDRGGSLLEANFAARDLMDFSVHGAWPAIRFLVQAVPFLNARLQGLHKMGRAVRDPQQRKQFVAVTGAVMMVSALLYLLFRDDDDFKQREDWDRDNYWWFKLPGSDYQFRLPKPFEVGALGTLAERVVEQIVDDEAHGDLFAERLGFMLHQTFAFSAVPQMFQPILDIYANKDPFTKRPIESMSMERLSPTERRRVWTTQTGIAASLAMDRISWGKVVLSPVQIDYLVEGYFGWLGASALAGVDLMARPATGAPVRPAKQIQDYPVIGRFVRENPNRHSKYVTTFYEQLQEIEQAYADIRAARKVHDTERAKSLREKHKDLLKNKARYTRAQRQLRQINNQITILYANDSMDAAAKRARLDELTRRKNEIAERVVEYGQ